jgi:hypothetical protein
MLLASLDRGIGLYEEWRKSAIYRKFNPLHWVAYLLALPLTILERAGLSIEETHSWLLATYGWFVRILVYWH